MKNELLAAQAAGVRQLVIGIIWIALGLLCFAVAAYAAEVKPEKAVTVIAPQNNYQAYAAGLQAAHQSRADQCESKTNALQAMAAKCASDICLALFAEKVDRACGEGAGAAMVQQLAPPALEKTLWQEIKETGKDLLATAFPYVDRVFARQERRDALLSTERTRVAEFGMYRDMNAATTGSLVTLGTAGINGVRDTATSGFGAIERTAAAAFKNPTYNINLNGNDNNLFGSTSTRTYSNQCQGGNGAGGSASNAAGGAGGGAPCEISK